MLEQSSQSSSQLSRVTWLVLLVVVFAVVVVVVVLIQKSKKTSMPESAATVNSSQEETVTNSPSSFIPMEKAQTQFQEIQNQVNAGTLSSEEAKKQMDELGAKIAPPELPEEAKK